MELRGSTTKLSGVAVGSLASLHYCGYSETVKTQLSFLEVVVVRGGPHFNLGVRVENGEFKMHGNPGSFTPFSGFKVVTPLAVLWCIISGCAEAPQAPKRLPTTDKIGEFDPNAGKEVVPLDAKVTDPITGPLEILKKVRVQLPTLQIEHALNLYNASEGNYPKTHEEFMTQIIKANNLVLPQLPGDLSYQYDVENHKLVIVRTGDGKIVE